MTQLFANNAFGSLGASLSFLPTSLTLATGQGARFPAPTAGDYFMLTLVGLDAGGNEAAWEIVKVTGRSADVLTIVRGQESTSAQAWPSGARVELRATAGSFSAKQDLIGFTVGRGGGNVSTNTAIGTNALSANITGYQNTALGYGALTSNIDGGANVAVGMNTLVANTTGNYNTALGRISLNANTTGENNTAIGSNSLISNTTGSYNTAVGHRSGLSLTTGSYNVILGGFTGNGAGLDIRTANNYIVLSDGNGTHRAYANGANWSFDNTISFKSQFNHGTTSGATTVAMSNGQNGKLTLSGAATLTFTFPGVGHYQLWLVSGANAVTWPTIGATWQWRNSTTPPTLNAGTHGGMVNLYWDGAMVVASYDKVGAV